MGAVTAPNSLAAASTSDDIASERAAANILSTSGRFVHDAKGCLGAQMASHWWWVLVGPNTTTHKLRARAKRILPHEACEASDVERAAERAKSWSRGLPRCGCWVSAVF